jgi:hypothetical protein
MDTATRVPGPSAVELAEAMLFQDKNFNRAHIRPSGVGMCLKAQVLMILNELYPEEEAFQPFNPEGKNGLLQMAILGDIHEGWRFDAWRRVYKGRLYGGDKQYNLETKRILNVDGTPVTAHPDIYAPDIPLDEEVKSTGESSADYLPKKPHVEQRLLRQAFWKYDVGVEPFGRIVYSFRETLTDPKNPAVFELIPDSRGMVALWDETLYEWDFIRSLEDRLRYIKTCVEKKEIPPRHPEASDQYYYECYFVTRTVQAQCPWREDCWAAELREERRPAIVVESAKELLREFVDLKTKQQEVEKVSRVLKERIKSVTRRLDPFFNEFGAKIGFGDIVVERKKVSVPARQQEAYEFYRYVLK